MKNFENKGNPKKGIIKLPNWVGTYKDSEGLVKYVWVNADSREEAARAIDAKQPEGNDWCLMGIEGPREK